MKITNYSIYLLMIIFLFSFSETKSGDCNAEQMRTQLKSKLGKFQYDSSKMVYFVLAEEETVQKIRVPLFAGEEYLFLFNVSLVTSKEFSVKIYNDNGSVVFSSSSASKSKSAVYTYQTEALESSGEYVIEYRSKIVDENSSSRGCVAYVLGFSS